MNILSLFNIQISQAYKSRIHLPKDKQVVNIWRLITVKSDNTNYLFMNAIELLNNNLFFWRCLIDELDISLYNKIIKHFQSILF
jgi:hypothetical protein